jgi:hypothetical protein
LSRLGFAASLSLAALAVAARADAPAASPPELDVSLKPHVTDGQVDYIDVHEKIERPNTSAGATLVHMPLIVASIPSARYDGDALSASDANGPLPLTSKDLPPTPFLTYREWSPTRATSGDVTLSFHTPPRQVSAATRNGPLFDVRAEAGGVHGAGYTFLPNPMDKNPRRIRIHWDLSGMGPGARGITSLGEGDVETVKPPEFLNSLFFFAGPVKSYPPKGSDHFAMYWLSEPPFDANAAAAVIEKLYAYMSAFFHDEGGSYRVFMRKQPYKGGGGTALYRSFLFGYGTGGTVPTTDSLEGLIAHEMTHNWPSLDGDHADTSWYSEGSAEYYSILLSFRAGLITPDEFLKRVNERAEGYYDNPLQRLTNHEAEAIYWKDARASHVPYGRGFMYLGEVDAEIRTRTGGKKSLDDVENALLELKRHGKPVSVEQWQDEVASYLGPDARREYADMVAGKLIKPPSNAFGPCFRTERYDVRPLEPGFDVAALERGSHLVSGLVAGSAAEKAGLKNGDEIVHAPDFAAPDLHRSDDPVEIVVRRAGQELKIKYVPLGAPVPAWRWARNPKVPDATCKA